MPDLVSAAAVATRGNVRALAKLLGISERTLHDIKRDNGARAHHGLRLLLAMIAANPDDAPRLIADAQAFLSRCK